jgi:hypothetical protein
MRGIVLALAFILAMPLATSFTGAIATAQDAGVTCGGQPCPLRKPMNVYSISTASGFKCGNHPCSPIDRPEDALAIDAAHKTLGMGSVAGLLAYKKCDNSPCPLVGKPMDLYAISAASSLRCGNHPCSPITRPEDAAAIDAAHQNLSSKLPY